MVFNFSQHAGSVGARRDLKTVDTARLLLIFTNQHLSRSEKTDESTGPAATAGKMHWEQILRFTNGKVKVSAGFHPD